jgi:Uma2 family endonuclease
MTADEFIAWAMEQPEGKRYELVDGYVHAMAPERVRHAKAKLLVARRLAEAVESAGLPCEVFPDGMSVPVDAETVYEPDALLRCGAPLDGDAVTVTDPVIVVEVLSPSTQSVDLGDKLAGYFRIPSLQHYLIIKPGSPVVIHHARAPDGDILTRLVREMPLRLDPPGVVFDPLG